MYMYLRIKIWFFDVHRVMKPVVGAKFPQSAPWRILETTTDERQKIKF